MNAAKRTTAPGAARSSSPRPPARPRPAREAARNPHAEPTARTRHAVGEAGQRDRTLPEVDNGPTEGGDWLAERIDAPGTPPKTSR